MEQHGLVIQTISQDSKSFLCMTTIIDCQNAKQLQVSKKNNKGRFRADQQHTSEFALVETFGQWPIDVNVGSHTMFLYCDLFQIETLRDTQLRCCDTFPLKACFSTKPSRRDVNQRSFSNLQWKRMCKSHFQSIFLTLANEMGKRLPFLSCGRTSITLPLMPKPH